jgi:hypothetical protein
VGWKLLILGKRIKNTVGTNPETFFYDDAGAPIGDVLLWSEETIHAGSPAGALVEAPAVASVELGVGLGAEIHRPYSWYLTKRQGTGTRYAGHCVNR